MSVELSKQLESSDEEERRLAVESIKGECSGESLGFIFKALGDDSWRVRKTAVDAMLQCSGGANQSSLIDKLTDSLRDEENPGLRNSAIEVLIQIGSPAAPKLIELFKDPDCEIRKFTCDILGEIKEKSAAEAIGELLDDEDNNVRSAAAEALGAIGGEGVVGILVAALDKENLWLRFSILESLGKLGSGVPYEPVVKFFDDQMLRKGVLDALRSTDDKRALGFFIRGLNDKSSITRNSAVLGLAKIVQTLPVETALEVKEDILRVIDEDAFLKMLGSHIAEVRLSAIRVLTLAGRLIHIEKLLEIGSGNEAADLIVDLFMSSKAESLDGLLSRLPCLGDRERSYACKILGSLGSPESVPVLINALKDNFGHTRRNALLALGRLNASTSIGDIANLLDDEFEDVSDAAVAALSQISSFSDQSKGQVMSFLTTGFKEKTPRIRHNITMIIGYIGNRDDLEIILSALKDENSKVRQSAVMALGSIKPNNALDYLSISLSDESNDVRLATINVMGSINSLESENLLKLALKDNDSWIKSAAIRSLTKIGTDSAVEAIAGMIKNDTVVVSITAIDSIAELCGRDGVRFIEEGLLHPDSAVVSSAKAKIDSLKY